MVRCPCHEDTQPSLAVRLAPDGSALYHCFGGCTSTPDGLKEVREALGGAFVGVTSPTPAEVVAPALPPLEVTLDPLTEAGHEILAGRGITQATASRFELGCARGRLALPVRDASAKLCDVRLWQSPAKRGSAPKILSWARGRGGSRLYPLCEAVNGVPRLRQLRDVLLVEGEMDALCACSLGVDAITTTGSGSSFSHKLANQLKELGVRTAHILMDNDITGITGTELRVKRLEEVGIHAAPVWWPKDTGQKWDICDEVKASGHLGRIL